MKGAIFDMDGTLVDSMHYWCKAFINKMDEENVPYPDDVMNIITPMGVKMCCEYMHNELGHPKTPEVIYKEIEDAMIEEYASNIPTKPYAVEYLKKLKEQGIKMCVFSASTHRMIEASAKKWGYFDLVEFVISCEEIGISKSNPEVFKIVAEKMGLQIEDVTIFDDNEIAVKSAAKSGAKVVAVYDKAAEEYEEELKEVADCYIYSFKELI